MSATSTPSSVTSHRDDAFHDSWPFVALYIGSLVLLAVVLQFLDTSLTRRILGAVIAAAAIAVFWIVTRPRLASDARESLPGGIAAVLFGLALFCVHPLFLFSLFGLFPLAFIAFPDRWETAIVVVLGSALCVAIAGWNDFQRDGWVEGIVQGGVAMLFSLVFGRWIERVIEQSKERAELIMELEQARVELAAADRHAGALAERDRLAGEIHDTIAQGLTSILMLVRGANRLVTTDPDRAREMLAMVEATTQDHLDETRALISDLRPPSLQSSSLPDALGRLVDRFRTETGTDARFVGPAAPPVIDAATEVVLLRAAQEAIANVRKHADASAVTVSLNVEPDRTALTVVDDGVGFAAEPDSTAANGSSGYGLAGMRARVDELGGSVSVISAPGSGTRVEVVVP
jgi:signal transduction histidine kinase